VDGRPETTLERMHILPGVDDGPQTMQEALALAQALSERFLNFAQSASFPCLPIRSGTGRFRRT
jgi:hypothetical protein